MVFSTKARRLREYESRKMKTKCFILKLFGKEDEYFS
jgi:hypothetical protein